jgi:hypothetical protein
VMGQKSICMYFILSYRMQFSVENSVILLGEFVDFQNRRSYKSQRLERWAVAGIPAVLRWD